MSDYMTDPTYEADPEFKEQALNDELFNQQADKAALTSKLPTTNQDYFFGDFRKCSFSGGRVHVKFKFNRVLVDQVKFNFVERKYDPKDYSWSWPVDKASLPETLKWLEEWKFAGIEQLKRDFDAWEASGPQERPSPELKSIITRIGELVLAAYADGKIDQQTQVDMLQIINTINMKDLIK